MVDDIHYAISLCWSDEDQAFVAFVPELPGCVAHGETLESALANAKTAITLWVNTAREFGDLVPVPDRYQFCIG